MKDLFNKKQIKKIALDLLLLLALAMLLVYGCPIYRITHTPCPCCGVTRAWIAFLQGNTELAFRYHALFPVIPVLILLYIGQDSVLARWRRVIDRVYLFSAGIIFVYALMRWVGFVDMP